MAKKQLDLNSLLQSMDRKDYGYYDRLSDEDKKLVHPLVLMRYMSSATGNTTEWYLRATNLYANKEFWNIPKEHSDYSG